MVKNKAENSLEALPEPTIWARAVLLGTAVLGVTMADRSLTGKNVELFGQKIRDAVRPLAPVAWALLQALEARTTAIGVHVETDRIRTARSSNALCEAVAKAPAPVIVELLAHARLDTSSSAVQATLATANQALATLEDPSVISALKKLQQLERSDLSAAKYLREARQIIQQDEMRRSLQVELRMVIGAAEAYLSTGKHSGLGADTPAITQNYDFSTPSPPSVATIVTPVAVVIESKTILSTVSENHPRIKKESVKKNAEPKDAKTLASEDLPVLTRVNVERKATGLDRAAARALLDEAYEEAVEKIAQAQAPMLVSVVLTYDVMRNE